jgi:hypothetical protein
LILKAIPIFHKDQVPAKSSRMRHSLCWRKKYLDSIFGATTAKVARRQRRTTQVENLGLPRKSRNALTEEPGDISAALPGTAANLQSVVPLNFPASGDIKLTAVTRLTGNSSPY